MKSIEINEQIEYGLETVDEGTTVNVKLKDLLLVYKTMEEFNRFFHNESHYSTIEDVKIYIGNIDSGAYSLIHKIYYNVLDKYIPKEIMDNRGEIGDPFENPKTPYYYES